MNVFEIWKNQNILGMHEKAEREQNRKGEAKRNNRLNAPTKSFRKINTFGQNQADNEYSDFHFYHNEDKQRSVINRVPTLRDSYNQPVTLM